MEPRRDTLGRTRHAHISTLPPASRAAGTPANLQPGALAAQYRASQAQAAASSRKRPAETDDRDKYKPDIAIILDLGTATIKAAAVALNGRHQAVHVNLSKGDSRMSSTVHIRKGTAAADGTTEPPDDALGFFIKLGSQLYSTDFIKLSHWKKYIGFTISDVEPDKVSEEFGVPIVSDDSPEQYMAFKVGHLRIAPHYMYRLCLRYIKGKLSKYNVKAVALTTPVAISDRARRLYIEAACDVFGLEPVHTYLVYEPLAGMYSRLQTWYEQLDRADIEALVNKVLVVVDVGDGTTDLLALRIMALGDGSGRYNWEVLAACGNNFLGGSDVNILLLDKVPDEVLHSAGAELRDIVREAKEDLCEQMKENPGIPPAQLKYVHGSLVLTGQDVVEAAQPLRPAFEQLLTHLLRVAGAQPEEAALVCPLGGSVDLPCVEPAITNVCPKVTIPESTGAGTLEIAQGGVDFILAKIGAVRGGGHAQVAQGRPGVQAFLPGPEVFLSSLPIGLPLYWRRTAYVCKEWDNEHMTVQDLQTIKAGLLSQGEQRAQEEAHLDACIVAKRKNHAKPPKAVGDLEVESLEPLLSGTERAGVTKVVEAPLVGSHVPGKNDITFDLYQGLLPNAVYIGSAKATVDSSENIQAQVTAAHHGRRQQHRGDEVRGAQLGQGQGGGVTHGAC